MSITSASTQADIVGQYLDNLSYRRNNSSTMCELFIEACTALMVMHPDDWQQQGEKITFDKSLWEKQLNKAERWLEYNGTSNQESVTHFGFSEGFR